IVLLYDGAISSMRLAQEGMSTSNFQDKARFLDRALRVIGELSASLNMEEGGNIAKDLRRMYEYMQFEMTQANLKNEPHRLEGPIHCLSVIREAWQDLAVQGAKPQAVGM
ncbi:MAG: flagellar export chaperone FliS, partial [Nitrospirota bacterium]|nr:flagellar export chaperone FliS [Nitrospirota bacterium]